MASLSDLVGVGCQVIMRTAELERKDGVEGSLTFPTSYKEKASRFIVSGEIGTASCIHKSPIRVNVDWIVLLSA